MQSRTETKVGVFVIFALAILIYMANYLGVFKWHLNNYQPYKVRFTDVSGLAKQADVKIAGVKAGWVDDIKLVDNGRCAEVTLMVDNNYKLYIDALVEIRQEGLLGNKFIDLIPGLNQDSLVLPGDNIKIPGLSATSIDSLVHKLDDVAKNIDLFVAKLIPVAQNLNHVTQKLDAVLDQDFNLMLSGLNDSLDSMQSIAKKLNGGGGSLGRLLNEDDIYEDLKVTTNNFKQVSQAYQNVGWVIDSHLEAFAKKTEGYAYKNAKSYLGGRLHLNHDWYALLQVVGSDQGGVTEREQIYTSYFNQNGEILTQAQLKALGCSYSVVPAVAKEAIVQRDTITYSCQIGKLLGNHYAFRFGFFESYFGMALDWDIPFNNKNVRWVSSFEMFDFKGQNRLDDRRPHLKWLNKVFLFKSCYFTFGVDDFASKCTLSPFFGMGIRFGGDDYDECVK